MDKATLLAEVINQVKELKKTARQVSDSVFVPLDSDEVKVEQDNENAEDGTAGSFRASICCEYRPGLLSDLKRALDSLQVNVVRSELSTLEGRMKNVFFFTAGERGEIGNAADTGAYLVSSVHQALSAILDKAAASAEYSPKTLIFPSKRRRVCYFDASSSSS